MNDTFLDFIKIKIFLLRGSIRALSLTLNELRLIAKNWKIDDNENISIKQLIILIRSGNL